jgi:hypothetical protein
MSERPIAGGSPRSRSPIGIVWASVLIAVIGAVVVLVDSIGLRDAIPGSIEPLTHREANGDTVTPMQSPGAETETQRIDVAPQSEFRIKCEDQSGTPVRGAGLVISGVNTTLEGVTDQSGCYTGLFSAPVLFVTASAAGIGCASTTMTQAEHAGRDVVMRLISYARVRVQVLDATGAGIEDCLVELGVAGVSAGARGFPIAPPPSKTGSRGWCQLEVDGYGIYSLRVRESSGRQIEAQLIQVRPGKTTSATVYVDANLAVRGRVVDEAGRAMAGARVVVGMSGLEVGGVERAEASSDESGVFSVSVRRPGKYFVSVRGRGYELPRPVACEVALAGPAPELLVTVRQSSAVHGQVLDGSGKPVPMLPVRAELVINETALDDGSELMSYDVRDMATALEATTDAAGQFVLRRGVGSAAPWRVVAEGVREDVYYYGSAVVAAGEEEEQSHPRQLVITAVQLAGARDVHEIVAHGVQPPVEWWQCRRNGAWPPAWTKVGQSLDLRLRGSLEGLALMCTSGSRQRLLMGGELVSALQSGQVTLDTAIVCRVKLVGALEVEQINDLRVVMHRGDGLPLLTVDLDRIEERVFCSRGLPPGVYSVCVVEGWRIRGRKMVTLSRDHVDIDVGVE